MIVIFLSYGTFLVVRLEKPINLMRTRTTCSIFKLFYTQFLFLSLVRVLYQVRSPQSIFYNDILDWQKNISHAEKNISRLTKIFLVRQKYLSIDKNISRPTKLISDPVNIFLDRQKYFYSTGKKFSITFVHYGFPLISVPTWRGSSLL